MITGTLPYFKCGVGDYTDIICSKLNKMDNTEVSVITTKGLSKNKDYTVYDIVNDWSFKDLKNIINKIDEIKPDIVHIQYPTILYKKNIMINLLPFFIRNKNFKIVITLHEFTDMSLQAKIRVLPNIYCCDKIIIVDKQYEKDIHTFPFLKNKKVSFINIGSNIPKATISNEEKNMNKAKVLGSNYKKIAGFFGFINSNKNLELILGALKNLKEKNVLLTKFMIIGDMNENNAYHLKIMNFIKENNLNDCIVTTGYLEKNQVSESISICDYFILPFTKGLSTKNGSFLAAMQENKFIVTTSKNGEKIFNSDKILYMQENNVKEMQNIILNIQQNKINIDTKQKLNLFSWDEIASKHFKEYTKIINNKFII